MNFAEESIYRQGYFKCLLDIRNWIERHSESLKRNKLFNKKGILLLLKGILENEEEFMEWGEWTEFVLKKDGSGIIFGGVDE